MMRNKNADSIERGLDCIGDLNFYKFLSTFRSFKAEDSPPVSLPTEADMSDIVGNAKSLSGVVKLEAFNKDRKDNESHLQAPTHRLSAERR